MASPLFARPDDAAERTRSRRATVITLGVLAALVSLIVLLTPVRDVGDETRLTTRSYAPGGARLTADLTRRLGWPTRVRDVAPVAPLDTTAIYAVFAGPVPMRPNEVGALLAAVRNGASLLAAPQADGSSPLYDSLRLSPQRSGPVDAHPLGECPAGTDALGALRLRTFMLTFDTTTHERDGVKKASALPLPAGAVTLLSSRVGPINQRGDSARKAERDSTSEPTVIAFPYGRGRIVAIADPDVLRTAQVRSCAMGSALILVRALEYLSPRGRRPVEFAEYYQTGRDDGPSVVLQEWLVGSRLGRTVLTLVLAGLVLLVARGRRTLAPLYREREERRSALEHVDALATAWRAVRGTRTVARLLARGIRRRHAAGRWRTLDDASFLAALAERHPPIADDVALLTAALDAPVSPADLPTLRTAAAHIDAECLTP